MSDRPKHIIIDDPIDPAKLTPEVRNQAIASFRESKVPAVIGHYGDREMRTPRQIAESVVSAGMVAWIGEGPCPCNIAVHVGSTRHVLAKGKVVFTMDDHRALVAAIEHAIEADRSQR